MCKASISVSTMQYNYAIIPQHTYIPHCINLNNNIDAAVSSTHAPSHCINLNISHSHSKLKNSKIYVSITVMPSLFLQLLHVITSCTISITNYCV